MTLSASFVQDGVLVSSPRHTVSYYSPCAGRCFLPVRRLKAEEGLFILQVW